MSKFYYFLTQKQIFLIKKTYKHKKLQLGNECLNKLLTQSLSESRDNIKELDKDKTKKPKKSLYNSSNGKWKLY